MTSRMAGFAACILRGDEDRLRGRSAMGTQAYHAMDEMEARSGANPVEKLAQP
jgi:hypothetical protein